MELSDAVSEQSSLKKQIYFYFLRIKSRKTDSFLSCLCGWIELTLDLFRTD